MLNCFLPLFKSIGSLGGKLVQAWRNWRLSRNPPSPVSDNQETSSHLLGHNHSTPSYGAVQCHPHSQDTSTYDQLVFAVKSQDHQKLKKFLSSQKIGLFRVYTQEKETGDVNEIYRSSGKNPYSEDNAVKRACQSNHPNLKFGIRFSRKDGTNVGVLVGNLSKEGSPIGRFKVSGFGRDTYLEELPEFKPSGVARLHS